MEEKLMPQVFEHEEFGKVRVVMKDGEPWFVAADVCRVLELADTHVAIRKLDDDEKGRCLIPTLGGEQQMTIVSEPGLYRLIAASRKPEAKRFQRWVYHEVLPSIRKTGSYGASSDIRLLADAISKFADLEREKLTFDKARFLINFISNEREEKHIHSELIRVAIKLVLDDDSIK